MMQEHVWLTEEFSVRKETLCFHEKTQLAPGGRVTDFRNAARVGTGFFCLLGAHHAGAHKFTANPDVRLYGFREERR